MGRTANSKRKRPLQLNNYAIADICEMWIAEMPIGYIAARHNITIQTVSRNITKHYLGVTSKKTFSITIQSKLNEL